jgi:hypothetical protein
MARQDTPDPDVLPDELRRMTEERLRRAEEEGDEEAASACYAELFADALARLEKKRAGGGGHAPPDDEDGDD